MLTASHANERDEKRNQAPVLPCKLDGKEPTPLLAEPATEPPATKAAYFITASSLNGNGARGINNFVLHASAAVNNITENHLLFLSFSTDHH